MAGLGLADDIIPWKPDTFGEVPETPAVAPTGGLGLAEEPSTGGTVPATARRTLQDESAGLTAPVQRGEPSPPPAPAPRKMGLTAEERQATLKKYAPQWDDDPIGAIAFVLQSVAAGMQGRELPADKLLKQAREHEALQLQKAQVGMGLLEHAQKLTKSISDPAKRKEAIAGLKSQFGPTLGPDFAKLLDSTLTGGVDPSVLKSATEHGEKLLGMTGGDVEKALELAKSKQIIDALDQQADARNMKVMPTKMETLQKIVQGRAAEDPQVAAWVAQLPKDSDGRPLLPYAMLTQINEMAPKGMGFTDSELRTLRSSPGLQLQLGVQSPETAVELEKSKQTQHSDIYKMGQDLKTARANGDYKTAAALEAALAKRSDESRGEIKSFVNPIDGKMVYADGKSEQARRLIAQGYEIHNDYEHKPREFQDVATGEVVVAMPSTMRALGRMHEFREFDRRGSSRTEVRQGDQTFTQETGGGPPATGYRVLDPAKMAAERPGALVRTGEIAPAPASGDTPPAPAADATPPLARESAGKAAPLVTPDNPRLDSFSTRVAVPDPKKTDKPERPPDRATRETFTHARIGLENFRIMKESVDLVGQNLTGAMTILKGVANPAGIFGDTTREAALRAAINSQEAEVQAVIAGVPTNKDQQIFSRALVPSRMDPKETYAATIAHSENVYKSVLTDLVAYHKGRGESVPKDVADTLRAFNIDPNKVHTWDGKGNPMQRSLDASVDGMSKQALQQTIDDIAKNPTKYSPEAIKRVIAAGKKQGL